MLRVKQLNITNFKSISKMDLTFTEQPGLVLVSGRNEVEPELGANGAGKSSLFEAMYWALYGRTPQDLKGPDLIMYGVSGLRVYVVLEKDGKQFKVERYQGPPNRLWLDGTDVQQDEIDKLMGVNELVFAQTCFFGQMAEQLVQLGAQEQTALLSSVLDLDKWVMYSQRAKKKAGEIEDLLSSMRVKRSSAEGRLIGLKEGLTEEDINERKDGYARDLEKIESDLSSLVLERKKLDAELAGLPSPESVIAKTQKDEIKELKNSIDEEISLAREELSEIKLANSQIATAIRRKKDSTNRLMAQIESLKENVCPFCKSILNDVKSLLRPVEKELADLSAEKIDTEKDPTSINKKILELSEMKVALDTELEMRDTVIVKDIARGSEIRGKITGVKNLITSKQQRISEIGEELQKIDKMVDEQKKKEEELLTILTQYKKDEELKESEKSIFTMWEKAFKDIRLRFLMEALNQFEIETNNVLSDFGFTSVKVRYAVDKVLSSGKIKPGFTIELDRDGRLVPLKSFSGGELQRIKVAVSMGFSDMLRSYRGVDISLEVWDEPTAWLADAGVEDLLGLLNARSERLSRTIYLIDHRSLEAGYFNGHIKIVKNADGSQISLL